MYSLNVGLAKFFLRYANTIHVALFIEWHKLFFEDYTRGYSYYKTEKALEKEIWLQKKVIQTHCGEN